MAIQTMLTEQAANATYAQAFGVDAIVGDALAAIQAAIESAATAGGGTVLLSPGHAYTVNGTIQMRSNVTLDLNSATITAVNNAAFTDINLGTDAITLTAYNPVSIKPVVSIIGTPATHLVNVVVKGGKIDGNGANQPDDGSYANVAVHEADYTAVDVESVNARPGITINLEGGANTGRRAFCLFVGHALKTIVRGIYRNAGYDTIGLREGAVETTLDNVGAYQAPKGAIQVATGSLRTKIIGGIYDNTAGGSITNSSHAIFCHSSIWLDVIGATMKANTGSCFAIFGDATWGTSKEVTLSNVAMEHSGDVPMIDATTQYVEQFRISNLTFRKTGLSNVMRMSGGTKRVAIAGISGSTTSTSTVFDLNAAMDVEISGIDVSSSSTANPGFSLVNCQRVTLKGIYSQVSGVGVYGAGNAGVNMAGLKLTCTDSVQFLGGNTDIDVDYCDLRNVTNANKLRIYGPDSGRVRGNKGAVTEMNGTATVLAAGTSVVVTHGLWAGTSTTATPRTDRLWAARDFQVSFAGNPGTASKVWVSAVTTTQVTFTVDAAPGADVALAWSARMDRTV